MTKPCSDVQRRGSRPVSRVLSRAAIHLRCASPRTCSDLPGSSCGRTVTLPYSVLLRVGFTLPQGVTTCAVRSYRTFSPLPDPKARRYVFCGTFRRLAPPRCYLAPCPKEPGLSSRTNPSGCPADSRAPLEYRRASQFRKRAPHTGAPRWRQRPLRLVRSVLPGQPRQPIDGIARQPGNFRCQ
jgi:hypothetical protein